MAKKKNNVKNNSETIEKVVTNTNTEVNSTNNEELQENITVLKEIIPITDNDEVELSNLSMEEIMSYKHGLNSILKYYTDLCEINRNIDEMGYRNALSKLNKLRKYETYIVEVIENKIKKIKL